jgi:hypothetical protein
MVKCKAIFIVSLLDCLDNVKPLKAEREREGEREKWGR